MKFWFDTFKGRLLLTAVTYVIYMMLYILTDQQSREFYFGGAPFMEYVLDAAITLGGSAGWTNNSCFAIINSGNWLLSAIGSLTQPLFNRGRTLPISVLPRPVRKRPCFHSASPFCRQS